jgi:hypothetical protein
MTSHQPKFPPFEQKAPKNRRWRAACARQSIFSRIVGLAPIPFRYAQARRLDKDTSRSG